ncbi:MAG: sigma-70 family RNA polymerase sigma factor [Myxococcota bacterium]
MDPKDRANQRPQQQPRGEENALPAYLADIAHIPILSREEQMLLAKENEAATYGYREALYRIPRTGREAVRLWREIRAAGRTTRRLSESYGSQSPDVGEKLDACLEKVERLLRRRERLRAPESPKNAAALERIDARVARLLVEADLSLELLRRIDRQLAEQRRKLRGRRAALALETGLRTEQVHERLRVLDEAHDRMTQAKNRFVWHNLKLVVSIAKDFRNMGIAFPDLIQEGNIGLGRAVEKFDWRRGYKFSTYAVWWIRQALIRAIQNQSRTIRIPSNQYDVKRAYQQARVRLETELERTPTSTEVAEALGIPAERAEEIEGLVAEPVSLEAEMRGAASDSRQPRRLVDRIEDPTVPSPFSSIDELRLQRAAHRSLEDLGERERHILCWRFGLDGQGEHTLQEIAQRLGLSRERVRQLEARALEKLRAGQEGALLRALAEGADE